MTDSIVNAPLIDHIGILVPDLEEAIGRWSALTGYTFSPIGRYRTSRYSDRSSTEPYFLDTRVSISRQGPPHIELLSVSGVGTHGPDQAGMHHLGIRGLDDIEEQLRLCARLGVRDDGRSVSEDGRLHLWFTDQNDMDGVRVEYIAGFPGPTVADDGSELRIDPATGRRSLWPPPSR